MLAIVLLVLFAACIAAAAPVFGVDTSDARAEARRPEQGWYPAVPTH